MCGIHNAIRELKLSAEKVVWVAFSGGLDSTVLLHACVQVLGSSRCRAIHINHQLSAHSERWIAHVSRVSLQWDVHLAVETVDLSPGNIELRARLSRYSVFRAKLEEGEVLLTAHHQDDDIETLCWQLFTGRATTGIPKSRSLGSGKVMRPFLQVTRRELEEYAKDHEFAWIDDDSNTDIRIDRNWLRHTILPQLKERFPQSSQNILKLKIASLPLGERKPLNITHNLLTISTLRSWLLAYELSPPTSVINEILNQSNARADATPEIKVGEDVYVRRYRSRFYVVRTFEVFAPREVTVGTPTVLSNGTLTWNEAPEGFEGGQNLLCTNRFHLPDEHRVIKYGALHKKITNLFQEVGVPPWDRTGWPILCADDNVASIVDIHSDNSLYCSNRSERKFLPTWNAFD